MDLTSALRRFARTRIIGSTAIPARTRWLMAIFGAVIGASFGFLAMKLSRKMSPGGEIVPWIVAAVGIGGVIGLQRLLRTHLMRGIEMQKDERAAQQIQTRLRPEVMPQPPGYELAGYYRAFRQVGGDYYEAMMLDERRLLLTIADVSGKGAGAALLTANLQAILKFVDLDDRPLAQITASINTHLCRHTESNRFITMIIGLIDLPSGRLTYVNAGHNPAMLHSGGQVRRLDATAPPLGAIEGLEFPALDITMAPGDTLVLFTDGLSERRNRAQRFFDEDGIEGALRSNGHHSAESVLSDLVGACESFSGGVPPDDDTAIVVVRMQPLLAGV
jgi:sigma-B regulation protein RsbU (phosphoserine phosphatase)